MATTHVRCSEESRLKLTEIANREGVSLAAALDILMNSLGPGDHQDRSGRSAVPFQERRQDERPEPGTLVGQEDRQLKAFEKKLEPIQETLDSLLSGNQHTHGGEPNCGTNEIRKLAWDQGFVEGVSRLGSIPGVMAAKEFNDWANGRNAEHPRLPVVTNLEDVPGVKEAVEKYQLGQSVITIIGPEEKLDLAQVVGMFNGR